MERVCFLARARPGRLDEYRQRHKSAKRWQAEMSEFFVADGLPDQSFLRITEIFHLN